jgi:hypothetical protein
MRFRPSCGIRLPAQAETEGDTPAPEAGSANVNGVNNTTGGRTMESPYFGTAARQLWDFVKGN